MLIVLGKPNYCGHCGNDWKRCVCTSADFDDSRTYEGRAIVSRDYLGVDRVLCHEGTDEPVTTDEEVTSFRGERTKIKGGRAPHKSGSSGKVWPINGGEYFPSVFGLHWK